MVQQADCMTRAWTTAKVMAAAGVPIGFFRAHVTLKDLTLAEKMQRYQNFKRTAKIMANPMFTFAACGFAFAAADCSMQNYLGRDSTLNGLVGGIAAGSVLGLKTNSAFNAVKYSALFGAGMIVADFLGTTVPELVGGDMRQMDPSVLSKKAEAQ
eukprot:GHUV01004236.1.p1 GENE.GHUV01004236.1~~GHUV01004236.1.p1  ORF type:complete len:155 (+),score=63.16 GHUV01004236.1:326-790(+)